MIKCRTITIDRWVVIAGKSVIEPCCNFRGAFSSNAKTYFSVIKDMNLTNIILGIGILP